MKIFIDLDENKRVVGWGSSSMGVNSIEIDIENIDEFLLEPMNHRVTDDFALVKDESFLLDSLRRKKDEELNKACQKSILDGFDHVVNGVTYHFSFDTESQLNFQGAERILSQGLVPAISWTVTENGEYKRVMITPQIMNELMFVILRHKDGNIARYREKLMPKVNSATTKAEIDAIHWDMLL